MEGILFGLDMGTTKVCAVVGEVRSGQLRIIGFGLAPAQGMNKGMIVDVAEASIAVAKAVEQAEETSGYDLSQALVSLAGEHIHSSNSNGAVAIHRQQGGVTTDDIERALDAAQAIPVPHNRQIVHLVPRHFQVDNVVVHRPLGMHGHRLEVEVHVVTGASMALLNLAKCADNVGIRAEEFVLNALASGEAVLELTSERWTSSWRTSAGARPTLPSTARAASSTPVSCRWVETTSRTISPSACACPSGRGEGQSAVWRLPSRRIDSESMFTVAPFSGERIMVGRQDLAAVMRPVLRRSSRWSCAKSKRRDMTACCQPASSDRRFGPAARITQVAQRVLNVPARVAGPRELVGMVDSLQPVLRRSVGLLRWARLGNNLYRPRERQSQWGAVSAPSCGRCCRSKA